MNEAHLNEKNLIEQLRAAFPELEARYKEIQKRYQGEGAPGNYEVVGSTLGRQVKEDAAKGEITNFLRGAALFIERVCNSGDLEAINVVWIKIFEWLIFQPKELHMLWPVLGPTTKQNIKDAARRWSDASRSLGRQQDLPINNLPDEP